MVKVFCDKCGKDCQLQAFDILIGKISDPAPTNIFDTSDLKITCENDKIRFILCQDCYIKLGLPNIYTAKREKKLTFRDEERLKG